MNIVMDTDVVVSALRSPSGASRPWLTEVLQGRVELSLTVPLVLQYEEVLLRPRHLAAFKGTPADVEAVLDGLCSVATPLKVFYLWRPMLRDPDDEMVLEAAVHGQVDALLTFNERHFVGADTVGVTVSRPGDAWRRWKEISQ